MDGKQGNSTNGHAGHQDVFHMTCSNQIGYQNAQKSTKYGHTGCLGPFFGCQITHVVSIHKPITDPCSSRTSRQPGDILSHIGKSRQQQEMMREQGGHHFHPGGDLQ